MQISAQVKSAKLPVHKENTGEIQWLGRVQTLLNHCHVVAAERSTKEITISILLGIWLENKVGY